MYNAFSNGRMRGRVQVMSRDPPGQRSIYIVPGNDEEEAYRAITFSRFPHDRVDTALLAKHGFIFVGYKDRVKCFSCGTTIEDWTEEDDPSSLAFHQQDCEFYTGVASRNKPIGANRASIFKRQTLRQLPARRVEADQALIGVATLQPFPQVTPQLLNSSSGQSSNNRNRSNTVVQNQVPDTPSNNTVDRNRRREQFPCTDPINPHMRNL